MKVKKLHENDEKMAQDTREILSRIIKGIFLLWLIINPGGIRNQGQGQSNLHQTNFTVWLFGTLGLSYPQGCDCEYGNHFVHRG